VKKDRAAALIVAGAGILAVLAESVQEGDRSSIVYCFIALAGIIYLFRTE